MRGWAPRRAGGFLADPSEVRFSHVFIAIFIKSCENELSGLHYYHVFIAIIAAEVVFSHVFIAISPVRMRGVPKSRLLMVLWGSQGCL